jgi:anti-sigma B factor antagonist
MDLLTIFQLTKGEWSIVAAQGEVDVASSPALLQAVTEAIKDGRKVVVDLSAVSFLDSTGLGVLVQALNESTEAGGTLRLVVTDPNVLKVFEVTALDDVFDIHASVTSATNED